MERGVSIDAVFVAYRSDATIAAAVEAARGLGGRVVVVDHGDGASAATAAARGAVPILDPTNPGFGSGQNCGVAATTSPFVLLCNPDAVVDASAVRRGAALLDTRPDVAAVQGAIVNARTGLPERSQGVELGPLHLWGRALGLRRFLGSPPVRRLLGRTRRFRDHVERVPSSEVEVESLAATAVLVRRRAFEDVGGFDTSFFLYGEDLDLCRRLRLQGWKLVAAPDVWARHLGGASAESAGSREVHWWRGTLGFAARWWGPAAWAMAVAAAALRWGGPVLLRRAPREALRLVLQEPLRARRSARPGPAPAVPARSTDAERGGDDRSDAHGSRCRHRISVVIRCHQQGRYLAAAVASVKAQSRPADEIVVVDDGSVDETSTVLEELRERDALVVVRHGTALGPAAAFNAGVRASSGSLVVALDADDELSARYLERAEAAIEEGADFAYGGLERFGAESSFAPPRRFDADELGVENLVHVSTLFKRWVFDATGGFRPELDRLGLEDWEFWVSAVELGARGKPVHDCWIRYRRHVGGSRNSISRRQALRVHWLVHRLHPVVVTRRHLARWAVRSMVRNLPALGGLQS